MTTFTTNSIDSNGSPSRPQDEVSTPTMTRRSPRNTADYDLLSGLPTIQKFAGPEAFPPAPSIVRPALPQTFKKRRRRSSHITQHFVTLEKCLFFGWFICFAVGYLVFCHWQFGASERQIPIDSSSSTTDRTPTPQQHVRSRSPQSIILQAKSTNAKPSSDTDATSYVEQESVSNEESAPDSGAGDDGVEESLLVHIIHSRFMQHQPHLIELGLARLELMKEFFLPSLLSQSSQNFLCVIRIDPDLNATVKDALLETMEATGDDFKYLIIASNETPHPEYLDIIKDEANAVSTNIVSGNYTAAKEYMMKTRNILETRLDVDDGLNQFFVEDLQDIAVDHFDFYHEHKDYSPWKVWCSSTHFEWQFQPSELWEAKEENPQTAPPNVTGTLLSIRSTICITAGLSVAYVAPDPASTDEQTLDLPTTQKHTSIHRDLPKCGPKQQSGGCFDFFNLIPTAIRARSPTSAGMYNIMWPHRSHDNATDNAPKNPHQYMQEARRQASNQAKFWNASEYYFDFGESSASRVHAYLSDHMKQIAEENLLGQCTHGHSCKNSSRMYLESILKDY